jgi:hypothetical protein
MEKSSLMRLDGWEWKPQYEKDLENEDFLMKNQKKRGNVRKDF